MENYLKKGTPMHQSADSLFSKQYPLWILIIQVVLLQGNKGRFYLSIEIMPQYIGPPRIKPASRQALFGSYFYMIQ